jgi:hypothetical protein
VRRTELVLSTIDDLLKSKDQFVGLASDVHDLKITLRLDEWSIELLGSYELRKLEELEEEGEPYVPAQQQMEQRVVEYMDKGPKSTLLSKTQTWMVEIGGSFPRPCCRGRCRGSSST